MFGHALLAMENAPSKSGSDQSPTVSAPLTRGWETPAQGTMHPNRPSTPHSTSWKLLYDAAAREVVDGMLERGLGRPLRGGGAGCRTGARHGGARRALPGVLPAHGRGGG